MEIVVGLQKEAEEGRLKGQKNIKDISHVDESGYLSEYEDSDDGIITPWESEEEDISGKKRKASVPMVNDCTDFSKLEWKVGMNFPNRQQFKDAVAKYLILQGRHLTFRISNINRQQRAGVECKKGCPFKLYGSWNSGRACFVVKSVVNKHNCNRNMKLNKQMKSTWLAEQFLEVFKSRPHWPASEICDTVRKAYRVIIKRGYAYKVKYWAHKKLHGSMKELDRLNQAAATALKAQNPKTFCRAFVKTNTKCDVIVNNMAQTFNGYIINARTKHMIYMLEDIRTALMLRLVNKKVYMKKLDTLLCPRIQAKLDKEKDKAGDCYAMPSSEVLFQVNYKMMDNLTVDLQQKTCTCGKWQLTGIPCCHVIACIYLSGEEAEPYVDECYYTTTYLKSYSRAIHPCKGERYWAKLNMPIDPPQIKIGPGRPRRNRRKDPHENPKKPGRLTRHGTELTCSVCKSTKHTKRKCPDKDKVVESQPKRGRGRPRKYGVTQPSQRQFEAANLSTHHNVAAEPSRTTRGGRTITRGRTFQKGNGSRGDKGRNVPTGFGVYVAPSGATMINNPGQASPTILSTGTASANYVNTFSSKASENSSMINQFPRTTNHG